MEKTLIIKTLADWEKLVDDLLIIVPPKDTATVVTLDGELGVGKTTFVQSLAKKLGVTEFVTSPTFTIMKGYDLVGNNKYERLVHMDAYRIENEQELTPLRFKELIAVPHTLFCIEWAERIASALPASVVKIQITHTKEEERAVVVTWPSN